MSRRALLAFGIFFIFSFLFYFVTTKETHEGAKVLFKPLGKETLKRAQTIEIYQGKEKKGFKLVREDHRWVLLSDFRKPANESLVENFLETLANLSGEERASGKKYFSRFGVGEEEGIHVVLRDGESVLAHLILGRRGPQWESTFVRFAGREKIYLVPVNLLAKLEVWEETPAPPKEKAFLDLEVLTLPVEEIKELSFEGQQISWKLTRRGEKYLFEGKGLKKEIDLEEGNCRRSLHLSRSSLGPDSMRAPPRQND